MILLMQCSKTAMYSNTVKGSKEMHDALWIYMIFFVSKLFFFWDLLNSQTCSKVFQLLIVGGGSNGKWKSFSDSKQERNVD